jgi:broad specificity phosphatase PhoE
MSPRSLASTAAPPAAAAPEATPSATRTRPALWLVRHGESTWNAAGLGLPVHTDSRLRERSLGVLEGSRSTTIGESVTGLAGGLVIDPDTRPPAGESVRDLYLRAAEFCDDLAARLRDGRYGREASPWPADPGPADSGGDVLVIAHGGTVRVLDAYLHGVAVDEMTWRPAGNAATVRIPEFGSQPRGGNR